MATTINDTAKSRRAPSGRVVQCCVCNKIRDYSGRWYNMDLFTIDHETVRFSHTYCHDCYAKALKDIAN